jgi:hypothetical protein
MESKHASISRAPPAIAAGAVAVDLGDRVVRAPHGPETVGDQLEVGLEDRLQHQLEGCLDHPVGDGRDAELAHLPASAGLGDLAFAHRQRAELTRLQHALQVLQVAREAEFPLNADDREAVDARGPGSLVARDPFERQEQRRRIAYEVEQIVEPAAVIGRRPTVKLGLHPRYPLARPRRGLGGTAVQRRVFRHCSLLLSSKPLPPFPMCRALPGSEYYGGSAPSRSGRPTVDPALLPHWTRGRRAEPGRFPCSLAVRSSE